MGVDAYIVLIASTGRESLVQRTEDEDEEIKGGSEGRKEGGGLGSFPV